MAIEEKTFAECSAEPRIGLVSEFFYFLAYNKKWWLLPILVVMGLVGALALFAGSGAAPFIYTFF